MPTQFERQISEIEAAINDETVLFGFYTGPASVNCAPDEGDAPRRRVLFEPVDGEPGPPHATGKVEVETGASALPMHAVSILVRVHIRAETFNHAWVLMNNVVYASRQSLRQGSEFAGIEFESDPDSIDSADFGGNDYMIVILRWKLHLFKGIQPLPPCGEPVEDFEKRGRLVPMTSYTHTGELT